MANENRRGLKALHIILKRPKGISISGVVSVNCTIRFVDRIVDVIGRY